MADPSGNLAGAEGGGEAWVGRALSADSWTWVRVKAGPQLARPTVKATVVVSKRRDMKAPGSAATALAGR
jgi:hypothetical protein